jgi:hypothetical protein
VERKHTIHEVSESDLTVLDETNALSQTMRPVVLGDRVRMSALGRSRHPKYGRREGLVVGQGSPNGRRVKFDGLRSVQTIHIDYLEKVDELPPDFPDDLNPQEAVRYPERTTEQDQVFEQS